MRTNKSGILIVASTVCLLCSLSACSEQSSDSFSEHSYEHVDYVSSIEQEDCYLCGDRTDHEASSYWGQDNLGLINVNNFEAYAIPINQYSTDGELDETATNIIRTSGDELGESRVDALIDTDYGWSRVGIKPKEGEIDPKAIEQHLCQGCLDEFMSHYYEHDKPIEIAAIDFASRELRPLEESYVLFFLGNYLVDCEFQENGNVNLLVVYRPRRYQVQT